MLKLAKHLAVLVLASLIGWLNIDHIINAGGSVNTNIGRFIKRYTAENTKDTYKFVCIGQKASDMLKRPYANEMQVRCSRVLPGHRGRRVYQRIAVVL